MIPKRLSKLIHSKNIAGTIFISSFTNLSIMLLTMLHSIITARVLGVEGRGELAAILFWPMFISGLIGLGLPTSLIYNVKQGIGNTPVYMKASLSYLVPAGIFAGAVAWFLLPVWLGEYSETAVRLAQMYTVFSIPLTLMTNILSALAKSMDRFYISNALLLTVPLINAISLAALSLSGSLNLITATISYLVPTLLTVVIVGFVLKKHVSNIESASCRADRSVKPLFHYGFKVYGMDLMSTLYTQADKIIIVSLLSPRDFGLYSVVFALSRVFNTVQLAITDVLFPKVSGLQKHDIISIVGKSFRISMTIMLVLLVPCLIIGRFFLLVLFGEEFLEADTTFYILSLECIIGGGSWILASSFNAIGRPELVLIRQATAIAVNIGLFFVFTPLFGLQGVALALMSGSIVRLAITLVQIPMIFKVRLGALLFNRGDFTDLRNILKDKTMKRRRMVS
ncbi:hypothetical protein BBD41_12720 [Paenibacillus ihbetae]|uniref:Uncharacterized protein n=1 Tax=Paenibacillus ihbetae TaxID=1870820 RepID=A0A1B2E0F9_9BACL|nr:oligosaccharide flippase family protein [Paenibacillus ihbetae]ANY73377.1 hypothetical protein BBD41_12720 [Paenibacillus ihbetae]